MFEQNTVEYWINTADYDIITAEAMQETKRFLYVGFMCHLVIEKILKAHFVKVHKTIPPYSHNLQYLAEKSDLFNELPDNYKDFLDSLQPMSIRARYPAARDELFKLLTEERCKKLIIETKEVMQWIKNKL
jgi:HEPN domain-containing protein